MVSKDCGAKYEVMQDRVEDIEGMYKLEKTIDFENFVSMFDGFGPEALLDPMFKFKMEKRGDTMISTDYVQGHPPIVSRFKLDEETVMDFDSKLRNV